MKIVAVVESEVARERVLLMEIQLLRGRGKTETK